jgi:hypothetical protein
MKIAPPPNNEEQREEGIQQRTGARWLEAVPTIHWPLFVVMYERLSLRASANQSISAAQN